MKGLLFDFGGTIDSDGVHWSEKFWDYYGKFNVPVQKPDFERAFVATERELGEVPVLKQATFYETLHKQLRLQFKFLKLDPKGPQLQAMLDECYQDVDRTVLKAKELIEKLSEHYRLGIVSNFYGNLEIVCREFDLYRYFTAYVDSVVVGLRKPDPAIWELGLKKLEVRPENGWTIGDSYERDVVPGKALGCTTIWLKGKTWNSPASTGAADYTIRKFEEIRSILL
ncbi:MAG TPA: HAD family hydrolase [Bacteroidota bacterium]|jgi:putative hydrolase of the HAD superfamily|nr:HAD family hydrolase [Bacteroidota bacterium]